jgi:predicted PurR-regulated permease PerM
MMAGRRPTDPEHDKPLVGAKGGTPSSAPTPPPVPDDEQGILGAAAGTVASQPLDASGIRLAAFNVSAWAIARYTLVVALVLGGLSLLWKIQEVLLLLLLAILFATAIEPLVNYLRRGPFSRGQGIAIVYSLLFATVAAIGFLFVPGLVQQAVQFVDTLPEQLNRLRPAIEQIELRPLRTVLLRAVSEAQPAVQRTLEQPVATDQPQRLVEAGGALAHTLLNVVTVFLLAYYWLTERATIKRGVLRLAPAARARQINATWVEVEAKLGGWVRGQLLAMLALGLMAGLACFLLGLPNPILLGALAGLFEIIPMVGPFLAFVPALLVALTVDPTKALLLIPIAIVIQQIEGNILIPKVMAHSVGISPLTVILGILIGAILYGAAGAFLAVPVAAAIQVILNYTLRPALEDETPRVPVPQAELEGEGQPDPALLS